MDMLSQVIAGIKPVEDNAAKLAKERLDKLTKPKESLGALEDFAVRIAGITGESRPELKNKVIFTVAADHGVADEGVSLFPKEVTTQMVYNFLNGGAGVNVLANHVGARVVVVDMGVATKIQTDSRNFLDHKVAPGTRNMLKGPAMSREEALQAIQSGMAAFSSQHIITRIHVIGLGEMGIGNTTAASAITACVTGAKIAEVTGRGTGIDEKQLKAKIDVISRAVELNRPNVKDPVDILSKLGGLEIAGLVGIILAAASNRVPVVVDGFITTSAALIAASLAPASKAYMFASHNSVEKGHRVALEWLGLDPILDLRLRLGEGTGACLAISLIDAGVKIMNEMATFEGAGVSKS